MACRIFVAFVPDCTRIGQAEDLEGRFAEAVEAREGLRETDKRETRILVQTHPDVLVVPPDPPQMMIKVDQVRQVIQTARYKPQEARRRVFVFVDSAFMKEAANALLKCWKSRRILPPFFCSPQSRRIAAHDPLPLRHFQSRRAARG